VSTHRAVDCTALGSKILFSTGKAAIEFAMTVAANAATSSHSAAATNSTNYMAAHERRLSRGERLRQSDHVELDGSDLFRPKAENNLEGVVAKEMDTA
jgi:ATP-dependent DNA ligase